MQLKQLKKQWWSLWSKDPHASAACGFCGARRAQAAHLVEGQACYVCDRCLMLSLGVLPADARETAFRALEAIVSALPRQAAYAVLEPLLEAMLTLAPSVAGKQRVYQQASQCGHYEFAQRALLAIPPDERSVAVWHDLAAMCIELERFEDAAAALAAPASAPGADDLFAECHRALVAVRTGHRLSGPAMADLVRRARIGGHAALIREALEGLARHRAADGDHQGALAAVDEALTTQRTWALLLLRGDLLAASDDKAAQAAWQEALSLAHPDSVVAQRIRERLHGVM